MSLRSRIPSIALQNNFSVRIELHALDFESDALLDVSFRDYLAEAEPALRVDHPVPRHPRMSGQGVQCVAHLSGVSRQARELGYLPIGGDAPGRDAADDRIDAFVSAARSQDALSLGPLERSSQCRLRGIRPRTGRSRSICPGRSRALLRQSCAPRNGTRRRTPRTACMIRDRSAL